MRIDIVLILLSLNILFLLIGYIIGRIHGFSGVSDIKPKSFFTKEKEQQGSVLNKIDIDTKRVVTDIKTNNLEKKYDQLGTTTQSNENISSAINKLKNMKG